MTHDTKVQVITFIIIFVFWLLRNTSLGFLWRITKTFFIVLFAILAAGLIKKEVKAWWNKD